MLFKLFFNYFLKSASGFRNEELNSMTDVGSTDMSTENVAISYDEERSIEHFHRWHDIQLCSRKLLADLRNLYGLDKFGNSSISKLLYTAVDK